MAGVGVIQAKELRNIHDFFERQDKKYEEGQFTFAESLSFLSANRRMSVLTDKLLRSWPATTEETQEEAVNLAGHLLEKFGVGSKYNRPSMYSKKNDLLTELVSRACALFSRVGPVHQDLPSRPADVGVFAYGIFISFLLSAAKFSETVLDLNDANVFSHDISQEDLDRLLTLNHQT